MSDSQPTGDWRAERRAEKSARKAARRERGHGDWYGPPIGGMIILAIGIIFLAGNFGFHLPNNWWAIFMLIPAAGALVTAARYYRRDGAVTSMVVGPAIGGTLLLAIALSLFLGLNWHMFWPVILIIVGLGIMARFRWRA